MNTAKENYLKAFKAFEKHVGSKEPTWIRSIRSQAVSRFKDLGFPTTKLEDWKYTNVDPIVKTSFHFNFEGLRDDVSLEQIQPYLFGKPEWNRLVFVNGFFEQPLSHTKDLPSGMKMMSLARAIAEHPETVTRYLAQVAPTDENAFAALNTGFVQDGAFIHIPKGVTLTEPIHLVFVTRASDDPFVSQPRNLIIADEASQSTVIEQFVSLSEASYFTNTVTEMVLGEGALLDRYKIQKESDRAFHVATTQAEQGRDSVLKSYSISSGAGLSRNDLNVVFREEGAECSLDGLYLTKGDQHMDHHTLIDHAKAHGTSNELFKGVLDEKATAVFNGKIHVRKNAQQTDAHQTNKNLILSDGARIDTKPQLDIDADDVKCTHGAAVGQLEDQEIFYLKSRGLSKDNARSLLTYGFASELIHRMKVEPVREELHRELWKWLGKEPLVEV